MTPAERQRYFMKARRRAQAAAAVRPLTSRSQALTTLILSVVLGLLSGAAWMQLT